MRYLELRSLDVNAFHPLGIAEEQIYFVEALMLLSLLQESPSIIVSEQKAIDWNELAAAHQGRDPALKLRRGDGGEISLRLWGLEICDALQPICEMLDEGLPEKPYQGSLEMQRDRLRDADLTPSARMLAEMRERGESFFQFAQRMSLQHHEYFAQQALNLEAQQLLEREAEDSRRRQQEIEAADNLSFDEFLEHYFSQTL